jgi:hypothetical protein
MVLSNSGLLGSSGVLEPKSAQTALLQWNATLGCLEMWIDALPTRGRWQNGLAPLDFRTRQEFVNREGAPAS